MRHTHRVVHELGGRILRDKLATVVGRTQLTTLATNAVPRGMGKTDRQTNRGRK